VSYKEGEPLPELHFDASLDVSFLRKLWRPLRYILIGLAMALCAVYAGDYVSLRFAIPNGRAQFGTVQVRREYAIAEKNNKVEFQFDPLQDQACVNSLFPHFGDAPCWYLLRHPLVQIDR